MQLLRILGEKVRPFVSTLFVSFILVSSFSDLSQAQVGRVPSPSERPTSPALGTPALRTLPPLVFEAQPAKNTAPDLGKMAGWFKRAQKNTRLVEAAKRKVSERQRRLSVANAQVSLARRRQASAASASFPNAKVANQAKSLATLRLVRALAQVEASKLKLWHQTELSTLLSGPAIVDGDIRLSAFSSSILTKRTETKNKLKQIFNQYVSQITDAQIRPQLTALAQATDAEFSNANH